MEDGGDWSGGDQSAGITVKLEEGAVKTEMVADLPGNDDLELDNVGDRLCVVAKVDLESEVELVGVQDDRCVMEDPLALEEPHMIMEGLGTLVEPQMEIDKSADSFPKRVKSKVTSKLEKIKPAVCTYCHTGFPSTDLYEHHLSTVHQDERPYSCRHCGKAFQNLTNCRRHETIHNPKRWLTEPQYHCDLCSKAYHFKTSMENHRKRAHLGYKPPKRCYQRPVLEHHSTKGTKNPNPYRKPKEIFPCPHCDRKFDMRCHLKGHLIFHTNERPFPCPICQQPFAQQKLVKVHIRNMHEKSTPSGVHHHRPKWQANQPCPCTVCGKVFSVPSQLRYHITLHTGELPHGCPTCGQKFRLKDSLKRHMILHNPQLKSNPLKHYKCRICGKEGFISFRDFRNHRVLNRDHAQIPYESEKEKSFTCRVCGKPHFLREDAIICAALGHDPSSLFQAMFKFKCPECPPEAFGFRNLALLRKHWEEEHPHKFLPTEFRKLMYNVNLREDDLPNARVDKKKKESWKTEGIPEDVLKSESPLYIELPLLPIPEEMRLNNRKNWTGKRVRKDLECELCGIRVANSGNLKRHLKVVHNPNRTEGGRKGYQCGQCSKLFWKMATLKAHEKTHQDGYQPEPRRPRKALFSKVSDIEKVIKLEVEEQHEEEDAEVKAEDGFCWKNEKENPHRVNVHDDKAVARILNYKTVQVSLLKWNFPQGMVDKCKAYYGLD